jgi:hypothetical protein
MIPYRGAAEHNGTVKMCQWCRQIYCICCLSIKVLPLRVPQIAIFRQVRVPLISFLILKGAVNQKRLKNTGIRRCRKIFGSLVVFLSNLSWIQPTVYPRTILHSLSVKFK